MNQDLEKILKETAEDTFASMAFVLPVEEEEQSEVAESPLVSACIRFSGPFEGGIFLSVAKEMLPVMAANLLGIIENDATDEEQQDALTEMLNVICGNILPLIATPKDIFHLSQPHSVVSNDPEENYITGDLQAKACLRLDCGRAELELYLNRSAEVCAS